MVFTMVGFIFSLICTAVFDKKTIKRDTIKMTNIKM